ncbi:hypothetical protein HOK51_03485 [Candidatus Woesearchaeota archaeon]|nr:hypothetical protein [Candidatus Woesearchaeota archaeon]MBT6518883.1 hypothetical protein [Candidatus Woesearchaeota archaeon]MBT7368485.1 hypothetical protein [Candidatus Woesearchaeota archaeon]
MTSEVIIQILAKTLISFLKILPILLVAVFVSQVLNYYTKKNHIEGHFKENEKNIFKASALGIATPGPLMAFIPILTVLKNKGLAPSLIVAFITAQTLIGPGRFFLETGYFGLEFFLNRLIISIFIAVAVGSCFRLVEKYVAL